MTSHLQDRVVFITGGGGGFGAELARQASERGAAVALIDVDRTALDGVADEIRAAGGRVVAERVDVTDLAAMRAVADRVVAELGSIDVMVNNAGIMPLAFFADHERAAAAWHRCLDINLGGVLNGIVAVHDHMIRQGRGHVVNLSSIYGNGPAPGAAVYAATKAAVVVLSESLRMESRGRIKVTTVRPTGVLGTGLGDAIVNPDAITGNLADPAAFADAVGGLMAGQPAEGHADPDDIRYVGITPSELVEQILYAIDQPWGIVISDVTVRAAGEQWVL